MITYNFAYLGRWLLCAAQAQDNRSQTIYRGGKSGIWSTRLHELEDMGIGVSLYFQFLKVCMPSPWKRWFEEENNGHVARARRHAWVVDSYVSYIQ